MPSEELVPGLSIEQVENKDEEYFIRLELEKTIINKEAILESRKHSVLASVHQRLLKGFPVTVTDEIKELGLAQTVMEMIQKAEFARKLNAVIYDEDDELDYFQARNPWDD